MTSLVDDLSRDALTIRSNNNFAAALRSFAIGYSKIFRHNVLLTRLATEEARHVLGIFMLHSHFTRDPLDPGSGITLSRTQDFAHTHGLATRNRVAALLLLLRTGGYMQQVSDAKDKRIKRMEPTRPALDVSKEIFSAFLAPLSLLYDAPGLVNRMEDSDQLLKRIAMHAHGYFTEHGSLVEQLPAMRLFIGRNGGYEILLRLITADRPGEVLPDRTRYFQYSGVARDFRVSRVHVRRLIEDAQKAGYLTLHAEGGRAIEVHDSLIAMTEHFVSLHLSLIWQAAKHCVSGAQNL
jgi:hypothetical protein